MSTTAEPTVERERPPADRRARLSRFVRIALTATFAAHVPVALAVTEIATRWGLRLPWLVGVAWAGAAFLLFASRARAGMPDRRKHEALVRLLDIPYFIHWCAAVYAFLPSVVATLVFPLIDLVRGVPVHLPMGAYLWSYVSGLVVCGYGVLVRRRWFHVVERDMAVPGLDPRLEGLRIAHLSDLHIGTLTPRAWGMRWAAATNARKPDLAVVTGDLVTSGGEFYADVADVVGALRAKNGVFSSMGNHDYFGGDSEPLVAMLRARGVRVLRNEGDVVEREGGGRLWMSAIDDTWTRRDDVERAMRGRPAGVPAVLLAHDPVSFDEAADAGADVVLSGHTHGGQIAMPFLYRIFTLASVYRYRLGFYRRGDSVLYVHPGLGTTGPPMRLGIAPEVTILRLRGA
jgi:predicted MPP superfamily phosphohydrolase